MKNHKPILFTLIALVFIDSIRYLSWIGGFEIPYETYISAFLTYISIGIFFRVAYFDNQEKPNITRTTQLLFNSLIIWNIIGLLRGVFLANDYWDWKFLFFSSLSFSFIPMAFYLGKNFAIAKTIFRFVLNYLFPFGFLLIPLTVISNDELYSRIMIPVGLFIIFIPYLKLKWKLLIVLVALTSILMVVGFRSNIIKITFSVLLLILTFGAYYIHKNWLIIFNSALFSIPIILFTLAVTDRYNVFLEMENEDELYTMNRSGDEENLMTDTRTFLYVEVLSSISNSGNWVIGESAIGSYETDWFYDEGGAMKGKRYGSEVGVLNNLMRNGVIGVVIYFLLLVTVSYNAIQNSNNFLAKVLGLFIAFRWTYSFVEEFTHYDLNFYFFWIVVGLVSSKQFRTMSDLDIKKFMELK